MDILIALILSLSATAEIIVHYFVGVLLKTQMDSGKKTQVYRLSVLKLNGF